MEKKNFRARVCKYAHQIFNQTSMAWSECMIKAWKLYHLAKAMRKGNVRFTYEKVDGSIREAEGTLQGLPAGITINGKRMTKPSYKTFAYYDIDKASFRCFKIENLLNVG